MKQFSNNSDEQMTEYRLEAILSNSQVKSQFFELGYGIFNLYRNVYEKYGEILYPHDDERRYQNFMEAEEDINYIERKNGGKSLLNQWFESNRDYIGSRLFGKNYEKVKQLERTLLDNKAINSLVSEDLSSEFLKFMAIGESDNKSVKEEKNNLIRAYKQALESIYRLYT